MSWKLPCGLSSSHSWQPQPSLFQLQGYATDGGDLAPGSEAQAGDLECSKCRRTFKHKESLRVHDRTIHLGQFPYFCSICGKGETRMQDLRGHMSTIHNMEKEFKCPHIGCGKEYGYKSLLTKHLKKNHSAERKYFGERRHWMHFSRICIHYKKPVLSKFTNELNNYDLYYRSGSLYHFF